ncbi:MAG: alpha-amylase, partial [Proteobacteria bacterium]
MCFGAFTKPSRKITGSSVRCNKPEVADTGLEHRLVAHLEVIYPDIDPAALKDELMTVMRLSNDMCAPRSHRNDWDQSDVVVIAYGDSVCSDGEKPLVTLKRFLDQRLANLIDTVHLLPFFPWSSDDGFAVIDYTCVNDALGDWEDVEAIAADYRLMADLVINHSSSRSRWFENFKRGVSPGKNYFRTRRPGEDVSRVVRPRSTPLFHTFRTVYGDVEVWCTFGPDQVDFDFTEPDVLLEFARIVRF